jgi:hypothetical protein
MPLIVEVNSDGRLGTSGLVPTNANRPFGFQVSDYPTTRAFDSNRGKFAFVMLTFDDKRWQNLKGG